MAMVLSLRGVAESPAEPAMTAWRACCTCKRHSSDGVHGATVELTDPSKRAGCAHTCLLSCTPSTQGAASY